MLCELFKISDTILHCFFSDLLLLLILCDRKILREIILCDPYLFHLGVLFNIDFLAAVLLQLHGAHCV